MAKTVTINSVELNKSITTQYGDVKTTHLLSYIDERGIQNKTIYSNSPLFNYLSENGKFLKEGVKVDIAFKKGNMFRGKDGIERQGWDLDKIAKEGTLTQNSGGGWKKSGAPPNPERELSMEISGLMQAVINHSGVTGLENNFRAAWALKKKLMVEFKSNTVEQPKVVTKEDEKAALNEQNTQHVISFEIDENDNPF